MNQNAASLQAPVTTVLRRDFCQLSRDLTVHEALEEVRRKGLGERIFYFYVVDEDKRLVGTVPTRRLLTAKLETRLRDLIEKRTVAIPRTATVMEACECFVLHRFLAFPVVDEERRIVGIVDVNFFRDEVFQIVEANESERADEVFEAIGFHIAQVRGASPAGAFRFRIPWLLATVISGTLCAVLTGMFEMTLARSLVLAFFLTLVLGLGEGVAIQSMAVAVQGLHSRRPSWDWFRRTAGKELATGLLLGSVCGLTVALIVWCWRGEPMAAGVIGASILGSLVAACLIGASVPTLLHAFRLDPKIAAGPLSLALTDISTLLIYFTLGAFLL